MYELIKKINIEYLKSCQLIDLGYINIKTKFDFTMFDILYKYDYFIIISVGSSEKYIITPDNNGFVYIYNDDPIADYINSNIRKAFWFKAYASNVLILEHGFTTAYITMFISKKFINEDLVEFTNNDKGLYLNFKNADFKSIPLIHYFNNNEEMKEYLIGALCHDLDFNEIITVYNLLEKIGISLQ